MKEERKMKIIHTLMVTEISITSWLKWLGAKWLKFKCKFEIKLQSLACVLTTAVHQFIYSTSRAAADTWAPVGYPDNSLPG